MTRRTTGKLLAAVNRTAEEEHLIELEAAQDRVFKITEDVKWLAGAVKRLSTKTRDQATTKLEARTLKVLKRLQAFADGHEGTYLFTNGFENYSRTMTCGRKEIIDA